MRRRRQVSGRSLHQAPSRAGYRASRGALVFRLRIAPRHYQDSVIIRSIVLAVYGELIAVGRRAQHDSPDREFHACIKKRAYPICKRCQVSRETMPCAGIGNSRPGRRPRIKRRLCPAKMCGHDQIARMCLNEHKQHDTPYAELPVSKDKRACHATCKGTRPCFT